MLIAVALCCSNLVLGWSTILKDLSLQTGIGKVISKEGSLDANTLNASLVWRFELQNKDPNLRIIKEIKLG